MEEILLEGLFQMLPSCKTDYQVKLTRQNVMLTPVVTTRRNQKLTSVLMQNVIGCRLFDSKIADDPSAFIQLVTMMKNKKGLRQRQDYTFKIMESTDKQENMAIGEIWNRSISWLLFDSSIAAEDLQEKDSYPPQRKFLVMLNPKSGPGKSLQLFKKTVEPLYQAAGIKTKLFITEYAGHCTAISQTYDFKEFDAIIISSGDGLVFEYINGIMSREDWQDCLKIPLGILPTGSGNALSASVAHASNECKTILNAVYITLKGSSKPMDLFCVENSKKKYYAFLSLSWGIISDIDIESEKYRALGNLRFTIGGLARIIGLRHYHGKFSYCLSKKPKQVDEDQKCDEDQKVEAALDAFSTNSCGATASAVSAVSSDCIELPALSDQIPESWESVSTDFVTVGVTSLTHLGTDMYSSPNSDFNDGKLNVQFIRKGITKKRMLDVFLAFETGKHLELPEVEEYEVVAFRLEPNISERGHIAVDGELIEYETIQGGIIPWPIHVIMNR